jgi:hypothetical protein
MQVCVLTAVLGFRGSWSALQDRRGPVGIIWQQILIWDLMAKKCFKQLLGLSLNGLFDYIILMLEVCSVIFLNFRRFYNIIMYATPKIPFI